MTTLTAEPRGRSISGLGPLRGVLAGLLLPAALVLVWQLGVSSGVLPSTLVAPPGAVVADLWRLLTAGVLERHIGVSLWRLVQGFAIGAVGGLAVGSWVGLSRRTQLLFEPTLSILAPIPPIAWIPLLIIALGINEGSKVALIAVGVFFVLTGNTIAGIRNVDARLVELARTHDKTEFQILITILLPGALPAVLTGLRTALGLSWILLIAAEMIASDRGGLGWFIYDARNYSRPDDMLAGMAAIGVLGMATDRTMLVLQRQCLVWQNSYSGI